MTKNDERGFTLIELMIVVLIIAILLAIAIPTFLGARKRANDRAVQSNIRNVMTNELAFFSDGQEFTEDPTKLRELDAAFTYVVDLALLTSAARVVYVDVTTTTNTSDTAFVAGKSPTGGCYWIRYIGSSGLPRFATDDCSGVGLVFEDTW